MAQKSSSSGKKRSSRRSQDEWKDQLKSNTPAAKEMLKTAGLALLIIVGGGLFAYSTTLGAGLAQKKTGVPIPKR